MLTHDRTLLSAGIAIEWPTVFDVASGAGHFRFVKEIVNLMDESNIGLDLQDMRGNTGFCFAALAGNMEIVELMLEKNRFLPKIRGGNGFTPLLFAVLQGRSDMAWFLHPMTIEILDEPEWNKLFFTCIDSGIFDLALEMVKDRPRLALSKYGDGATGLHILALKKTNLRSHSSEYQNQLKMSSGMKHGVVLQLVDSLWRGQRNSRSTELMKSYPDLMWDLDSRMRSIVHIAVLYRHPDIFNLIHDISANKDIILSNVDPDDGNNILHLAAKLAPTDRLELVSGAAFQMKLELLCALRKDAESWMKRTSGSCLVVSTLIATGVFSAAFSIPGGTNDNTGVPHYLGTRSFMVFAISDAIALISSSSSILVFLSILISRYAECDFYKALPLKLIFGLVTLFFSITSMMIAFSSAFFITYDHGLKWVPSLISLLSFLPIVIFLFLQFKLFYDIIYSTYYLRFLFRPTKHMLF
ncbi:hypothetical protein K1719_002288 [Acacia pycnantha]|nr:hypothetical protein K1719_002288 [Acacia pycnantha]